MIVEYTYGNGHKLIMLLALTTRGRKITNLNT